MVNNEENGRAAHMSEEDVGDYFDGTHDHRDNMDDNCGRKELSV